MKQKKTGNKKRSEFWNPQWIATIVAAIIVGYMTYLGSVEPVRLEIQATQTAEARLFPTSSIDIAATKLHQNIVSTQRAFATNISLTEQSMMATATAIMRSASTPTPIPVATSNTTNTPVATINDVPSFFQFFFVIILAVISFTNKTSRGILVDRVTNLITKPTVFQSDKSTPVPFYPRRIFEELAKASINIFGFPFIKNLIVSLTGFIKEKVQSSPRIYIGYLVKLIMFLCFIWADAISTANSLAALSLISGNVHPLLTRYEFAVLFGSILSLIVGVWVIVDSKDTNNKRSGFAYKIIVISGYFLLISGLLVTLIFTLARYAALGLLSNEYQQFLKIIDGIVLVVLIPANNLISTFVIFEEALMGITAVAILLSSIFLIETYILGFLLKVVTSISIFVIDVAFRLILIYMYFTSFLLLTPLDLIFRTSLSSFKKE